MIARHEVPMDKMDIWSKLAAPLPSGSVSWRQDGKASMRDGRWYARFVAYIEAGTVRERLDAVCAGEWDLTLELLPALPNADDDAANAAFKARLQILGVIREDVGTGRDYKSAATDAFKRVAVRFGIGAELYLYEQNWVLVDGDSKYAKPLEDPQTAYNRRYAGRAGIVGVTAAAVAPVQAANDPTLTAQQQAEKDRVEQERKASREAQERNDVAATASTASAAGEPECPKCGGRMWDNRAGKRNPKAPDFKCRDRSCDGVIWPPKPARGNQKEAHSVGEMPELDVAPLATGTDDIPF